MVVDLQGMDPAVTLLGSCLALPGSCLDPDTDETVPHGGGDDVT